MSRKVEVIRRSTTTAAENKTVMTEKKRVAAYCRISTDLEEQQSSLQTQTESFTAQINTRPDWTLIGVYADEGVTGTQVKHRTEFLRMMKDCDDGKIDYIITKSISRFARNTLECLSYVRRLKAKNIFVYFEKERLDTSSDASEMLLSILAAVAQEESRNISENIKWSQRKRYAEGKAKWAAIYGYKKEGEIEYIIDEEQAAGVRMLFDRYMKGKSMPEICIELYEAGFLSPWGNRWTPNAISKVLKNEKYCGDVLIQKSYTADHISKQRIINDQSIVPSYYIRNHHTPIIDRKTFDMVQIIRSLKDRHKGAVQYPYYGKLICPLCGGLMVRSCTKGYGRPPVWRCISDSDNEECRGYFIREKYVDAAFKQAYAELNLEALEKQADSRNENIASAAKEAIRFKTEMAELETVEYYLLDALVDNMTFSGKWSVMTVKWTFGTKSKVDINYEKNSHIPNHKEQLASVASVSITKKTPNLPPKQANFHAFERPSVYGYDTTVDGQVQ